MRLYLDALRSVAWHREFHSATVTARSTALRFVKTQRTAGDGFIIEFVDFNALAQTSSQ
jgi:hypothetical protein